MRNFLDDYCKTCGKKYNAKYPADSFCSKKCEKIKIELLHNDFRIFSDWEYQIIFKPLIIHDEGVRYKQRQPPIWCQINIENGKCWCGKPKSMFAKQMRKYCTNEHARFWHYYINSYWDAFRIEIIKRDNFTCQGCGLVATNDYEAFDVDHIQAITLGGMCFDETNVRAICKNCHKFKTKQDMGKKAEQRKASGIESLDLYAVEISP